MSCLSQIISGYKKLHKSTSRVSGNDIWEFGNGNGQDPFPKFGNRKGTKKSIPIIQEKGIREFHSWESTGVGIPAHPCITWHID